MQLGHTATGIRRLARSLIHNGHVLTLRSRSPKTLRWIHTVSGAFRCAGRTDTPNDARTSPAGAGARCGGPTKSHDAGSDVEI
ncbi:hypothetical protein SSAG_02906 [Streptomyces sp. Mg1]|nr:hypothetical protein SSAG_02906 [Streptomyces sp. Mg1]